MAEGAPDPASLRLLGQRVRPVAGAAEKLLEVPPALAGLLPGGGLPRGSLVAAEGPAASSLALALVGPVTRTGCWVAVVGLGDLGLLAASELGVDLARVLLVAAPDPPRWAATVDALVDAVEVVLTRPPRPVATGLQRRLTARARDRGSVLVQVGGSPGVWATAPDLVLSATGTEWQGVGRGHGHLRARKMEVSVRGRRGADRPRRASIWLPGPDGQISLAPASPPAGSVAPTRPVPVEQAG